MTIMKEFTTNLMTSKAARMVIDAEQRSELVVGHKWYVIPNDWWGEFLQKVETSKNDDIIKMAPICNASLVEKDENDAYVLKPNLQLQIHIQVIPEPLFIEIKAAFGIEDEERDTIIREVVSGTLMEQKTFIEIYPLLIKVADCTRREEVQLIPISQGDSIEKIRKTIMDRLNVNEDDRPGAQFLIEENGQFEAIPATISHTKLSALLNSGAIVFVDITGKEGKGGPDAPQSSARTSRQTLPRSTSHYQPGLCGLQNMGNTCFMNSALQCLGNVPELTEYFLRSDHIAEINEQNPLGTKGALVREYADLVKEMWSGMNSAVRPFRLKCVIGEFAPRFNGYAQQDSQELTAFLLDGLHEDLNRIKKKPYVEEKEVDGRNDQEAASEAWLDYKKRNDSIIVDLLHGQIKSTLTCNICNKVSVKFDPFCFLSVPIPAKERQAKSVITFVRKEKWAKFSVTHTSKTTARQIKEMLREQLQLQFGTQIVLLTYYGGDLVDDDTLIAPPYPGLNSKYFYAYSLSAGPVMLVENRCAPYGPQSLCPILPVNLPKKLTRRHIINEVVPTMKMLFWRPSIGTGQSSSALQQNEDEMNGNSEQMDASESEEQNFPAEILLSQANTGDRIFPDDLEEGMSYIEDGPLLRIVMKWPEATRQLFHTVDLQNLVDREVNMTTTMKRAYSLLECIELYTQREQLNEEDSWYCPRCKSHQRAFKKLDLWALPKILLIHLKRFIYSRYTRDKIDTEIEIPVRGLDLGEKVLNPAHRQQKYDLVAISNHMGGLGSGHYTAYALNGEQWCEFNDSTAMKLGRQMADVINSREAYMLVYRRRD